MKSKLLIGAGIIIILIAGMGLGYWATQTVAKDYFLKDLIPSATLDEKDAFVESIPVDVSLEPKQLSRNVKKAKNVIFLIGDGMSISQVSAYRLVQGGPNSRIAVDRFPYSGIVLTHAENAIVTDSASSATAYSTGRKTNNGALGMDSENNELENLTETLDQYGFVSSLLATSEITHATPAAFAAHVDLRWKTDEISAQMIESKVATFLGGGRHFFLPEEMDGKRKDARNLLEEVNASHTLLTTKDEMNDFNDNKLGKVFGLFADEHLRSIDSPDNHSSEPSLSEMLQFAVKRSGQFINNGCKGFFIMGEGSQVDWAGHSNNLEYLIREMQDLDSAVEWAFNYAKQNTDTLVVVTADHETGGLLIEPANPADYNGNEVKFSFNTAVGRGTHTGVPVPVYAYGPGAENFTGTLDNTDVYRAVIEALELGEKGSSCIPN
ncbi:MAG TPA: alkaline phosphatase [Gammaproteobacteria bacterium]|nr:alkaline phosphatase [Gammaproteobacteria bacterium]